MLSISISYVVLSIFYANLLENVSSKLIPSENFFANTFSIGLIYRPWVLDNITTRRVFVDATKIINFLHMKDTFKDSMIDESQNEQALNTSSS